ncbi:unnamed protein product [Protopolystoma xenopodis]|uniref:Uncharacterized protein n=1 Tax=Protopolystoma xenopodis TaxID=117903 RepID=A0A3S5FBT6_9PLAT|nr:unnamed protein product [Protopolystoma xenopodis]
MLSGRVLLQLSNEVAVWLVMFSFLDYKHGVHSPGHQGSGKSPTSWLDQQQLSLYNFFSLLACLYFSRIGTYIKDHKNFPPLNLWWST